MKIDLEDVVLLSSVQLLKDVTELMQEQYGTNKSIKLEMLALSLARVVTELECNNEEV